MTTNGIAPGGPSDPPVFSATRLFQCFETAQGREADLWSSAIVLGAAAAAGLAVMVLSNLLWAREPADMRSGQLSVLLAGLVALFALFNLYAAEQRRVLQRTRAELVKQMAFRVAAENEALHDPLTGACNRRYLKHILATEASRADRLDSSLSLLMVDVDDFRLVNNRFGHVEGDRLLKEVARVLLRTFRDSDTVIRYGGDEFLVLLPEASERQTLQAVTRLQRAVAQWNRDSSRSGYEMILSCGIATYSRGADILAVLHSADQRMYAHKRRSKISESARVDDFSS
jgi:diguanylate cyclase (GGDEF)-like protein